MLTLILEASYTRRSKDERAGSALCVLKLLYMCVLILLYMCAHMCVVAKGSSLVRGVHMCPHTTLYVCAHVCPHTTMYGAQSRERLHSLTYAHVC
jgi:hypothetical protein